MALQPGNTLSAERIHPRELAYLGDAVFELHVREQLVWAVLTQRQRHRAVVERVRATAQARALRGLESVLTDEERDIVRRARNVKTPVPRWIDQDIYRSSTAFEALIGYRYLSGPPDRLRDLLATADRAIDEETPRT